MLETIIIQNVLKLLISLGTPQLSILLSFHHAGTYELNSVLFPNILRDHSYLQKNDEVFKTLGMVGALINLSTITSNI